MANYFEDFGDSFRESISGYAAGVSTQMIDQLGIPITAALTLYFLVKAYLILAGRSPNFFPDLVLNCLKIGLVSFFALNTGNFIGYVIPVVYGTEEFLLQAVRSGVNSADIHSAWGSIDMLWETFVGTWDAVMSLAGSFGWWSAAPSIICVFLLAAVLGIVGVFFTFAAVGILLINEVLLTLVIGFGPLFLCALMFPVTRGWFDGWIKSLLTFVFTLTMAAAVILLFCEVFNDNIDGIRSIAIGNSTASEKLSDLFLPVLNFCVLGLTAATLVKLIPTVTAALVGGVNMGAVGLGQMLTGAGKTAAVIAGAAAVGMGTAMGSETVKSWGSRTLGSQGLTQTGALGMAAAGFTAGAAVRGATAAAGAISNTRLARALGAIQADAPSQNTSSSGNSAATAATVSSAGSLHNSQSFSAETSASSAAGGSSNIGDGSSSPSVSAASNPSDGIYSAAGQSVQASASAHRSSLTASAQQETKSTSQFEQTARANAKAAEALASQVREKANITENTSVNRTKNLKS